MDTSLSKTTPTTSRYIKEFESLFVPIQAGQLRNRARNGELRQCQFRSLCWRYFLHCLPENGDDWLESCTKSRRQYEQIKAKHAPGKQMPLKNVSPCPITSESNDAQEITIQIHGQSSKLKDLDNQQYNEAANECDHTNVFRIIERDVVRTFPDMEFFRQTEMQDLLSNVLYNYASENPHLSYKQGMHELVATLLFVLHTDSQNCLINYEGGYANETISTLLDFAYLEHDVFYLFCALMQCIGTWYQNDDILTVSETSKNDSIINRSSKQVGSVLGIKLKKISDNIVKNYDLQLFNHLEALQIPPQIYGIRWMRLLFGREFEFLDLLTIWDAIICDQVPTSLADYIFASMLLTIREELVNGDYTECLNNLMRHQFKDVQFVVKLALHLRDPANNARPKTISKSGGQKLFNKKLSNSRYNSKTSLANKLSQQYTSDKRPIAINQSAYSGIDADFSSQQNIISGNRNPFGTNNINSSSMFHDGYRIDNYQTNSMADAATSGIKFLSSSIDRSHAATSKNKFIPNINKFVTSIGQNIQEKAGQFQQPSTNYTSSRTKQRSSHGALIDERVVANSRQYDQQQRQVSKSNPSGPSIVREFEMLEINSTMRDRNPKLTLSDQKSTLNISTDSYGDLHSIVDYCWRLLSEQIDSLQRCLPKEKSLHSEDEIFVAVAQLKKVRDVLKGSLKLDDELESSSSSNALSGLTKPAIGRK